MLRSVPLKRVQPALAFAARHPDEDLSLAKLAEQASLSVFHLHRVFSAVAGETPKQFALRLRLSRAAGLLLTAQESVLDVSLACGFQSHEVFCRAFRRRFGMTPTAYRKRGLVAGAATTHATEHAALVNQVGPCVGLYHISDEIRPEGKDMTYSIEKKELTPQRVLVVRRRVKRSAIAATIGEVLPKVFVYAQQHGIALAGLPFTRYVEVGPGLVTMEPGMRVVAAPAQNPADTDVIADTLPGGPVVTTMHAGSYDKLTDAYAAIQEWIEARGLKAAGPPWESYVNDPTDHPDPADWKTEVFWPVAG